MATKRFAIQTLKKITVSTLVAFMAFGSLMFIPLEHVSAAIQGDGGGTNARLIDSFSPAVQAQIYSSIQLVLSNDCSFATSVTGFGTGSSGISPSDISLGNWFANNDGNGGNSGNIGQHVSLTDGMVDCANGNNWFSNLLNEAGLAGSFQTTAAQVFNVNADGTYSTKGDVLSTNALRVVFQNQFYAGAAIPSTAPPYIAYEILMADFTSTAPNACAAKLAPSAPDAYALAAKDHTAATIYTYDTTTKQVSKQKFLYVNPSNAMTVGHGLGVGSATNAQAECQTIASALGNQKYANALKTYFVNNPTTPTTSVALGAGATHATCEKGGFGLNWILCPVFNTVAGFCDWLFANLVQPLLRTAPISTNSADPSYKIWSNFRIYGDIFLVIALLVVVFGQSLGGGLIDAYTAKKVLPRLLAAAILINLSIYIVAFLVDVTNILGGGLGSLITSPLSGAGAFKITPSGVQAGAVAGFTGVGLVGAWGTGMLASLASVDAAAFIGLFVLLPALFGLLAAIITLVLRKAIILALVLLSPIAFALYVLPNTEKYFHKWWELLLQTLMVYPIVIVIFAIADVLTVTLTQANNGAVLGSLALIIAFVLQFLPLVMIPYAFKLAGGIIGNMHGVLTGFGKRSHEALKGNVNDRSSLQNRVKHNFAENRTRGQARAVDAGRKLNASRFQRTRGRFADRFGDVDARLAQFNAEEHELGDKMSGTGRDSLRYAGAGYRLAAGQAAASGTTGGTTGGSVSGTTEAYDRFFDGKGREISGNTYKRGKELYGSGASAIGQGLEYTLRKATTEEDIGNFRNAFAQNAIANNWDDNEAMDVWASSTFGHKDKWRSEWYSSPKTIKGAGGRTAGVRFDDVDASTTSYDKMINEFHKVPASFQLSSTRAQDWKSMGSTIQTIQPKITAGTASPSELERYAKTSEVLDTMTSRGLVTQSTDGDVIVQGANAETQGVVSSIFKSRQYETTPQQTAPGVFSPSTRSIYDAREVERLTRGGPGAPPISKQDAIYNTAGVIHASAVVTGDRSTIPRVIT